MAVRMLACTSVEIEKINIGLYPVISADRRFVWLTLGAQPTSEGKEKNADQGCPPVQLNKALSVPDGHTLLLCGWEKTAWKMWRALVSQVSSLANYLDLAGYGLPMENVVVLIRPRVIVNE